VYTFGYVLGNEKTEEIFGHRLEYYRFYGILSFKKITNDGMNTFGLNGDYVHHLQLSRFRDEKKD
jgi:hypothetical protein